MSSDAEWTYVNVRRLFLFVEESIDEGTQWVVFEPQRRADLGARCARSIANFLTQRLAQRRADGHDARARRSSSSATARR